MPAQVEPTLAIARIVPGDNLRGDVRRGNFVGDACVDPIVAKLADFDVQQRCLAERRLVIDTSYPCLEVDVLLRFDRDELSRASERLFRGAVIKTREAL